MNNKIINIEDYLVFLNEGVFERFEEIINQLPFASVELKDLYFTVLNNIKAAYYERKSVDSATAVIECKNNLKQLLDALKRDINAHDAYRPIAIEGSKKMENVRANIIISGQMAFDNVDKIQRQKK